MKSLKNIGVIIIVALIFFGAIIWCFAEKIDGLKKRVLWYNN